MLLRKKNILTPRHNGTIVQLGAETRLLSENRKVTRGRQDSFAVPGAAFYGGENSAGGVLRLRKL